MLYRASRDGFAENDFYSKCKNIQNTLTVIKTTNGNVFGGCTEYPWGGGSFNCYNKNEFLFSLVNEDNKKFKASSKYAGHYDICISSNSNENSNSYSNFGYSYHHPDYELNSIPAGSNNFQTVDIEVFSIN